MADQAHPPLYNAIMAKLWEARRNARDRQDEPGMAELLGAAEAVELFLNWHLPFGSYGGRPSCDACTGENIVTWPCDYTTQIARRLGIETGRG